MSRLENRYAIVPGEKAVKIRRGTGKRISSAGANVILFGTLIPKYLTRKRFIPNAVHGLYTGRARTDGRVGSGSDGRGGGEIVY